ncbi:MAG: HAD family phosphatase [Acidobacteria bacterium]|nr:HAD family phosphatase [Acidobacteriota bacterium]
MIKAILFDFNGVIIDDEPIQLKAYQELLKAEDVPLSEEDYYQMLGMDDATFLRASYERAGKELTEEKLKELIERKVAEHRRITADELPLFPGVVNFIKAASRHFTLGIVSMALRAEIDYVLERAGLAGIFDGIVSAEDVETCKPDPACYNRGFLLLDEQRRKDGRLNISPHECLVVEDAPPGIQSARDAGMKTLGVTNTVKEAALRAAGADVVTHSLADWTVDAVHHVFNE